MAWFSRVHSNSRTAVMYVPRIHSVDSLKHTVCVDLRTPNPTLLGCVERFLMRLCPESLRIGASGGTPRDFKSIDDVRRINWQGMDEVAIAARKKIKGIHQRQSRISKRRAGVNPYPLMALRFLIVPDRMNYITFLSLYA